MKPMSQMDADSLVILGGWNANILLNLPWLKKYLFPDEQELKVEFALELGPAALPTILTRKLRMSLLGPKLAFRPVELPPKEEDYDLIEEIAIKIADYLPHTPVSAVGVNFLYQLADGVQGSHICPKGTCQEVHKVLGEFGSVTEEVHKFAVTSGTRTLNFSIQLSSDGSRTFNFNFHHLLSTLADYKELASEHSILQYRNMAEGYLDALLRTALDKSEILDGNE